MMFEKRSFWLLDRDRNRNQRSVPKHPTPKTPTTTTTKITKPSLSVYELVRGRRLVEPKLRRGQQSSDVITLEGVFLVSYLHKVYIN